MHVCACNVVRQRIFGFQEMSKVCVSTVWSLHMHVPHKFSTGLDSTNHAYGSLQEQSSSVERRKCCTIRG